MIRFIQICILFSCAHLYSQNANNFIRFERSDSISIKYHKTILENAWSGGLNCPQFSKFNFNNDSIADLFVFDRSNNLIQIFYGVRENDTIKYHFVDVSDQFPLLKFWALAIDYDKDGKDDIFTYNTGGICVYKNVSKGNLFEFKLIKKMLLSDYGTGTSVNIYVNEADIPAIADLDGDGDLDVLSFHILGSFIQYHKNLSVEKYGHLDSLVFEIKENCWGNFSESENNNQIQTNILCPLNKVRAEDTRHTGSTLLALDLDEDKDKDLLMGDVDFRGLSALYNTGNSLTAFIGTYDSLFPKQNPINFTSMPAAYEFDYDADGVLDLLIAPNDANKSIDKRNVFLYKKDTFNHSYTLIKNDFLSSSVIDLGTGAYPSFFDYNNDGLKDLVVGNYGSFISSKDSNASIYSQYRSTLTLFKNIGTPTDPAFELIDTNYLNLDTLKEISLIPFFADMDNDADLDLICGKENGQLIYVENSGMGNNAFVFEFITKNFMGIDVGKFSSPIVFDLNHDQLPDIISGSRDGRLYYYQNMGSKINAYFQTIPTKTRLGNVDVVDHNLSYYGYSTPQIIIAGNDTLLFCGSESGNTYVYQGINDRNEDFSLMDSLFTNTYQGIRTSFAFSDLNQDGFLDMIAGNYSGGLMFYQGKKPFAVGMNENGRDDDINIYPNPVKDELNVLSNVNANYQIYNSLGQKIGYGTLHSPNTYIDTKSYKRGVYVLILQNKTETIGHYKFIK